MTTEEWIKLIITNAGIMSIIWFIIKRGFLFIERRFVVKQVLNAKGRASYEDKETRVIKDD